VRVAFSALPVSLIIEAAKKPGVTNDVRSNAELVGAVLEGDRASFAELVRRYQRMVLAIAWQALGDHHAAEDAAQEAFVAAYRKLAALRDPARFGPWMMRIVRRTALRIRERRRPTTEPLESAGDPPSPVDADPLDEDLQRLLEAVTRLPDHERVVVMLRYLDGHSVAAIAEMTGRPLGTVTKQLSRAVARLRESLEEVEA
jgi:RNA polymerase sigma-70 factor (ECF subfamily)